VNSDLRLISIKNRSEDQIKTLRNRRLPSTCQFRQRMIKDVHINNPSPLLERDEIRSRFAHGLREHRYFSRSGCVLEIAMALLAISSFIIHYLGWQGERGFGGT
jgi:hypothetical protein